jgi:lipoyl(octanoyl) transferase
LLLMPNLLQILDLGRREYEPVLRLQERLAERRQRDEIPDSLVLVEHEPVYTLGRAAKEGNVVASEEDLRRLGVRVVRTTRGGDVTFHGPGQLVGYPILRLPGGSRAVVAYVRNLEEVIIRALAGLGVIGERDARHRGVWVQQDKIAALGVRVTRGVTMHGFALNVRVDLAYYGGIIPCGIRGRGVTSLDRLVPGIEMDDMKRRVVAAFVEVFGYRRTEGGARL